MSSIISGASDVDTAFQETFKDFTSLDPTTATYKDIKSRQETNRVKSEELNKEFVTLINMKQVELEKSNERIQKLINEIANCKGAKDLAQLENLLSAEQIYSQNITNEIQGLKLKQDAISSQQKKLADDAEQASQEKLAADFGKVAEQAKVNIGSRSTTITESFDKKVEAIGWNDMTSFFNMLNEITDVITSAVLNGMIRLQEPMVELLVVLAIIGIASNWEMYFASESWNWGNLFVKIIHIGFYAFLIRNWKMLLLTVKKTGDN